MCGVAVRAMKVGLTITQADSGQELLDRRVENKGGVHPGVAPEVEMLLQPRQGQIRASLPPLRSTGSEGSRSGLPQFRERASWRIEKACPMRAIGGEIELEVISGDGIAEKELGHIIFPEVLMKESGARRRVAESRSLTCATEYKGVPLKGKTEKDRRIHLIPKPVPRETGEGRRPVAGNRIDGHFVGVQTICLKEVDI
ncbi:hypothetical protein CMK17_21635 [Candidatus Poribacteria bacterium]|nr:hypothetical protein [Candidatus Poribacteria bacterium]